MKKKLWKYLGWTGGTLLAGGAVALCVQHIRAAALSSGEREDPSAFEVSGDEITTTPDAARAAGIRTLKIEARDVPVTLTLTGRTGLDMEHVAHVHAQFGGKVVRVGPQLGDTVKGPDVPGGPTVLCAIESNDLAQAKASYLQAKVTLKLDEQNLVRTRELVKSTVLADKFLIDAESAVVKDRATLEATRQALLVFGLGQREIDSIESQVGRQRMDYLITAPRSGVVAEKGVAGGEVADPTVNLFTIADTSTMWVWGDVYERDLRRIKVGQPVKVVFTSEPDRVRDCRIDWISPVLDPNTHSVRVRGSLDNRDGHLLSDMYGTMVVTVDAGRGALVVPAPCVVRRGTDAYVLVAIRGDGSGAVAYRRTKVTIEPINMGIGASDWAAAAATADGARGNAGDQGAGRMVRVTTGLRPGDLLVCGGALGLLNEIEQQEQQ